MSYYLILFHFRAKKIIGWKKSLSGSFFFLHLPAKTKILQRLPKNFFSKEITRQLVTNLKMKILFPDMTPFEKIKFVATTITTAGLALVTVQTFLRARKFHREDQACKHAVSFDSSTEPLALIKESKFANNVAYVKLQGFVSAENILTSPNEGKKCVQWTTRTYTHYSQCTGTTKVSGGVKKQLSLWSLGSRVEKSSNEWKSRKEEVATVHDTANNIFIRMDSGGDSLNSSTIQLHLRGVTGGPGRHLLVKVMDKFTPTNGKNGYQTIILSIIFQFGIYIILLYFFIIFFIF